jgi:hypothetical protein
MVRVVIYTKVCCVFNNPIYNILRTVAKIYAALGIFVVICDCVSRQETA